MAVDAVCDLLGPVPDVEIGSVDYEEHIGRDYQIDLRIALTRSGVNYALIIEVKPNGAPRFVRSAIYHLRDYVAHVNPSNQADANRRLIPMLVSPYLSPESRAICTDHNVAYLDLFGNAHLAFDGVYIDRAVADKPKSESRALRSIFNPKAAAILRVMLREPDRAWRVTDLAEKANASLGHVSNVRKALLEREWIEKRVDGVVFVQPDALLKTWRENYRRPSGHHILGYTHLHGKQFDELLSRGLNPYPQRPRAIYSLHSAAQWFAPFGRDGTHTFYADESGAQFLQEALGLKPVSKGANVVLCIPNDESLFDDAIEPAPSIFCTSPIITYLDLWNGNDRDREAAEYVAREFFPWLK
ncbi:MAG: hypothetical protein OXI35_18770 [Gemmatimonadota bacterium]|nr:hypothetical protein [Gemmatimonadota bacterium]